jgi:hypothetical protein
MNTLAVWVLVGIAAISVAGVLIGRRASRLGFLRGRSRIDVDKTGLAVPMDGESRVASELIQAAGVAYRIDPGFLRLDDSLADLAKLDSWDLGSGQERLEKWLRERGVTSPVGEARTLRDLIAHIRSR